jgi:hypothetical protein
VGGEVQPDIQADVFATAAAAADFMDTVERAHPTWLLNATAANGPLPQAQRARAAAAVDRMGYALVLTEVDLPEVAAGLPLRAAVRLQNTGVAPFPADWPLVLQVRSALGGVLLESALETPSLRTVTAGGAAVEFRWDVAHALAAGTYAVRVGVRQPLAGGLPVKLGNAAYANGWVDVGNLVVNAGVALDGGLGLPDAATGSADGGGPDAAASADGGGALDAAGPADGGAGQGGVDGAVEPGVPSSSSGSDGGAAPACACARVEGRPDRTGWMMVMAAVHGVAWIRRRRRGERAAGRSPGYGCNHPVGSQPSTSALWGILMGLLNPSGTTRDRGAQRRRGARP